MLPSILYWGRGLALSHRARNFSTCPPTGTPRRALTPGEESPRPRVAQAQEIARLPFLSLPFLFSYSSSPVLKGVAKVALSTARIERGPS